MKVSLEFLRDIVEVLIYILLPVNEFRCIPVRVLLRVNNIFYVLTIIDLLFFLKEVIVNLGLIPFIDMYSDPDTINRLTITMVKEKKEED